MTLAGHLWTIVPKMLPMPAEPPALPWETTVEDPRLGPVRLTGRWSRVPGARHAVLLVHGITGNAESRYLRTAAAAALAMGISVLRISLRGCDRQGEDYYHGGLAGDLAVALASRELADHEGFLALGFSLGGHLVLRLACGPPVPRLAAVAAICAPLDLAAGQVAIDRPRGTLYRGYVLRGLKQIYAACAERRPVPLEVSEARRIRSLWEWDERVVAPRHGFAGADDYYARESVGPRLDGLSVPALLVAAEADPMVPAATLRPWLATPPAPLTVRWIDGGHLGFPDGLLLDPEEAEAGAPAEAQPKLDRQVLAWLAARGS
ncbi:MAG TPA: alpha/beta fold hydrolase [Thermoanaerobaculia bacterium]|nr:alpha/beta fold hydrolase [Thermoanaerobaculia bacterium]